MFTLNYLEHSPRVTLLQLLLKDEYPLTIDGIFGPKTQAALKAFQASRSKVPTGIANPETWQDLLAGTGLAVVSSVDLGDPRLGDDAQLLREAGDDPIEIGGMCNGLGQLVSSVSARAEGKKIAALRLDGHGNLGRWLTISVGDVVDMSPQDYAETAKEYYSYVDPAHFATVSPLLGRLTPKFARFGFAEHHGCSLGKQPATRKMLAKLANLWGVPFSVGVEKQPVGAVTFFKGPVFTAFPHGMNLRSWSHQFQKTTVRTMSMAPTSSSSLRYMR